MTFVNESHISVPVFSFGNILPVFWSTSPVGDELCSTSISAWYIPVQWDPPDRILSVFLSMTPAHGWGIWLRKTSPWGVMLPICWLSSLNGLDQWTQINLLHLSLEHSPNTKLVWYCQASVLPSSVFSKVNILRSLTAFVWRIVCAC